MVVDNNNLRIFNIIDTKFSLLMNNPNICGIAHGYKIINYNTTNIPSLTFFVRKKFNSSALNSHYLIPKTINGAISDVVEVGKFEYCNGPTKPPTPLRRGYSTQNKPPKPAVPLRPGYTIQNPFNPNSGIVTCALREGLIPKNLLLLTAGHVVRAINKEDPNCIVYPKLTKDEEVGSRVGDSLNDVFYLSDVKTVPKKQQVSPAECYNLFDFGIIAVGPYNDETMKNIFSPYLPKNESFGYILDPLKASNINGPLEILIVDLGFRRTRNPKIAYTQMVVEIENEENKTLYRNQMVVSGIPVIAGDSGAMIIKRQHENRCDVIGMVMGRAVSVPFDGINRTFTVVTPLFNIINEFVKDLGKAQLNVALLRDGP